MVGYIAVGRRENILVNRHGDFVDGYSERRVRQEVDVPLQFDFRNRIGEVRVGGANFNLFTRSLRDASFDKGVHFTRELLPAKAI